MKYQAGEIYFVREFESGTTTFTPFVKIGLVADPRISDERLIEHQTGNPRKLVIPDKHIVRTDAVSMVEAQLHRRFAKSRVGGEWFKFEKEDDLSAAIKHATELAEQAAQLVPILFEADRLQKLPSTDEMLTATEEHLDLARDLAASKEVSKRISSLETEIKAFLASARKKGEEIGAAAEVQLKKFKPKFQESDFAESYPDIYKEFQVEVKKWEGRFLQKLKWSEDIPIDQALLSDFAEAEDQVAKAFEAESIADLGEPILGLARLSGLAEWDENVATAKLKVACGTAAGIEGICTWKRLEVLREEFDLGSFVKAHLDLYTSYLGDETTKEYVLPAKGSKRK